VESHAHGRRGHPDRLADLCRLETADEPETDDRAVLWVEPPERIAKVDQCGMVDVTRPV
jgi:hypothetical protein